MKQPPKKLTIISGTYPPMPCGVGDYTAILARHLAELGIEVSVISSMEAQKQHEQVQLYAMIEKWHWPALKQIINKLHDIQPEAILFQWPTAAYGRSLAVNYLPKAIKRQFPHVPLLATLHELRYFKPWTRWRLTWLYQVVDQLILVDSMDYQWLPKKNRSQSTIHQIPIGSNIPKAKEFSRLTYRQSLGINIEDFLLVFFGFVNPPKGIELLLDGLNEINNERVRLLLLSELKEGNHYHKKIMNRINKSSLKTGTIIRCNQPANEIAKLLKSADCAVLPFKDGASLKRGTLMACITQHMPIITTIPKDDDKKIFKHQENIWLVPDNDKRALKEAILYLMKHPDSRSALAYGASKMDRIFNWRKIAEKYADIIDRKGMV